MALGKTQTIAQLMEEVAYNDMVGAKKTVVQLCEENNSQSYRTFCERIKQAIEAQPHLVSMSIKTENMLYTEDVEQFDEELFFVSEQEKELLARIQTMERTIEQMQDAGIKYRNAALLFGPSGSGKTTFAKYLAKKTGRKFYMVNIASIIDSRMGQTAQNMQAIFQSIESAGSNCLLLLDELDALSNNRDADKVSAQSTDRELSRATMALMQQLDLLPPQTLLIAATNRIEALDIAVKRRFPVHHHFLPFTEDERRAMITQYLTTIQKRAKFTLTWDGDALETFVKDTRLARQSAIVDALVQCIADMVEEKKEKLEFPKKESPAWGKVIQTVQQR